MLTYVSALNSQRMLETYGFGNTLEMHVWNAFRASHHRACTQANMVKRNRLPPQMSFLTFRVDLAASSKAQQTDTIGGAEIPGYT